MASLSHYSQFTFPFVYAYLSSYGFLSFTAITRGFRYKIVHQNNRSILKRNYYINPTHQNSSSIADMQSPSESIHTYYPGSKETSSKSANDFEKFLTCNEELLSDLEESQRCKTRTAPSRYPETITRLRIPAASGNTQESVIKPSLAAKSASEENSRAQSGMVRYRIEPRTSLSVGSIQLPPGINESKLSPGIIAIMKTLSPKPSSKLGGQIVVNRPPHRYVTLAPKPTGGPPHTIHPVSNLATVSKCDSNRKLLYTDFISV